MNITANIPTKVQPLVNSWFELAKNRPYAIMKVIEPKKAPTTKSIRFAILKRKLGTSARTAHPKTEKITQPSTKPISGSSIRRNNNIDAESKTKIPE